MAWVFTLGNGGRVKVRWLRGLPGHKSSFLKGNWTFKRGHGGQAEKYEKGKHGAYLGNFHSVAQLTSRNSKPWKVDRWSPMAGDRECQSEGLECYSFGLLAEFLTCTDQAETGEVTCPRPHDWPGRGEPNTHFFWPPDQRCFCLPACPQQHCRVNVININCMTVIQRGKFSYKLQKLYLVFSKRDLRAQHIKKVGLWVIPL